MGLGANNTFQLHSKHTNERNKLKKPNKPNPQNPQKPKTYGKAIQMENSKTHYGQHN